MITNKDVSIVGKRRHNLKSLKRILVTGSTGFLGSRIVEIAQSRYEVIPTHHRHPFFTNSVRLDVTNKPEVFRVIKKFEPSVLIHAAAQTHVDKCETEKSLAWKTNSLGTRNLAEVCGEMDIKLVYLSTDFVFDGEKGLYRERDEPKPVNYYGLTKLAGEEFVKKHCRAYIIARTSLLYGLHSRHVNFATWVLNALRHNKQVTAIHDQYSSPTLADNLAQALVEIVEKDLIGVYHMAGSERINRFNFAIKVAKTFDLDVGLIKSIKMNELKVWTARRPKDSSLCIDKAQKNLKTRFLSVNEGLSLMKEKTNKINISNYQNKIVDTLDKR